MTGWVLRSEKNTSPGEASAANAKDRLGNGRPRAGIRVRNTFVSSSECPGQKGSVLSGARSRVAEGTRALYVAAAANRRYEETDNPLCVNAGTRSAKLHLEAGRCWSLVGACNTLSPSMLPTPR
jgi:hypothetical protein